MSYYSEKNSAKKQWYVVNYKEFNYYYVGRNLGQRPTINKNPLTYNEATKFKDILCFFLYQFLARILFLVTQVVQ